MTKLHPYLRFNDSKCKEAMEFYEKALGGKITMLQTVGESPMAGEMPADKQKLIMHATFQGKDFEFFASDMMRDKALVGDNIAMSLNCDNEKEAQDFFAQLSEGGEIFMPLEKVFWGALFGMLTDKYGIEWMINYQIEK